MKKWTNAAIDELNIVDTAYGKNLRANEANARKGKKNNGAGGSLNLQPPTPVVTPVITPTNDELVGDSTVTTADQLS